MTRRKRLLAIVGGLTATLAAASIVLSPAASTATGNGAPSGSHYNLNIIGVPKDKTASMTNSERHTIFVPLWRSCAITLTVGDFHVADGNCTDGSAAFSLPNPDSNNDGTTSYSVFARALGAPDGSSVTTTCAYDSSNVLVCSSISLTLTREAGRTQFSNASKYLLYIYANDSRYPLFDGRLHDYFWEYDNRGLRLAQLRFYDCPTTVPGATDPTGPQEDSACFA